MLSLMEFRHLRYFVAVAEEENVTRAAARLHVSQPTLSRQISDLEDGVGVALFDHGARTIKLTAAGRVFWKKREPSYSASTSRCRWCARLPAENAA